MKRDISKLFSLAYFTFLRCDCWKSLINKCDLHCFSLGESGVSLLPDTQEHTKRWLSCLTDGMSGAALAFLWTYPSPSFIYLVNIYSACPVVGAWSNIRSGPPTCQDRRHQSTLQTVIKLQKYKCCEGHQSVQNVAPGSELGTPEAS